jgi:hypothetical protein
MTDLAPVDNELITAMARDDHPALLVGGTGARGDRSGGAQLWNRT